MDITPAIPEDRQVIDSYGPGRFQVAMTAFHGSIVVFPSEVVPWALSATEDLTAESFDFLQARTAGLEVLLLGTGAGSVFVRPSLRAEIKARIGVGFDAMDTGAACRTYNILLSEGRKVAAALIAV
ncbi:MAG: Mth938-like domain-containing protein [Alphaproteobacteria bacterium]|nr:Mth938-like domain-containing protein [Alphaproteobacteria bacterium]